MANSALYCSASPSPLMPDDTPASIPSKLSLRMTFTTPDTASAPYTADAPSRKISTRSTIAVGTKVRSAAWLARASAKVATRLPLIRMSTRSGPRLRRSIDVDPPPESTLDWLNPDVPATAWFRSASPRLPKPDSSTDCPVMTVIGLAEAKSLRLMREPVTTISSISS